MKGVPCFHVALLIGQHAGGLKDAGIARVFPVLLAAPGRFVAGGVGVRKACDAHALKNLLQRTFFREHVAALASQEVLQPEDAAAG